MRALALRLLTAALTATLTAALATACSGAAQTPAPATPPAAPAPANQGIAVGEPNPATPVARPASITDADIELAEKAIVVITKLSTAMTDAGANCQQAAAAIRAIIPELKAGIAETQPLDEKLKSDPAGREWFEKTYNPRLQQASEKLMASPCVSDPGVAEAMAELEK